MPRARRLPDNRMTWTKYDVKDRTKRSGTRIARERAKELKNLDNYEGQEKDEVGENKLKGKEQESQTAPEKQQSGQKVSRCHG